MEGGIRSLSDAGLLIFVVSGDNFDMSGKVG